LSNNSEIDSVTRLIYAISTRRDNHKRLADQRIINSIDSLLLLIQTKKIAFSDRNSSGKVWGRHSILKNISDQFDPVLNELLPVGSFAWCEMRDLGTRLPLKNHMSKDNLQKISDNLRSTCQTIENCYDSEFDNWDKMVQVGESLTAVAEIIDAVREALPIISLQWCDLCFRRVVFGKKYCHVHNSYSLNDTNYRKAKRIRATMDVETIKKWRIYMTERRVFGDSVVLVASPEDSLDSVFHNSRILRINPDDKNLAEKTLQSDWADASAKWKETVSFNYPLISKKLKMQPSEFESWEKYSTYLLTVIQDKDEDSRHPFWILNILDCAEEWFLSEHKFKDGRTSETENEINKLFNDGVTSPVEIAKRIGKSKQYVYRILKNNPWLK